MLLDEAFPRWDATRVEHRVVDRGRHSVFAAARELDFLDVPREVTAVRWLFGMRTAAERVVGAVRGRPPTPAEPPSAMRLADLASRGEWVALGERPDEEIAFGAVGRFWSGDTAWRTIDARELAGFAEPGFARIGCNLSFRDYGARTLVSYEARTAATDEPARAAFLRYWRVVDPFVGVVMRATLRLLAHPVATGADGTDEAGGASVDGG
jgi:hypothetical protein